MGATLVVAGVSSNCRESVDIVSGCYTLDATWADTMWMSLIENARWKRTRWMWIHLLVKSSRKMIIEDVERMRKLGAKGVMEGHIQRSRQAVQLLLLWNDGLDAQRRSRGRRIRTCGWKKKGEYPKHK